MSSLEGCPGYYEAEDWQLLKTQHSYQASKYQMDLIATILDRRVLKGSNGSNAPRHLIIHPAVTHTNVSHALASGITDFLKVISFYLVSNFSRFNSGHLNIRRLLGAFPGIPQPPDPPVQGRDLSSPCIPRCSRFLTYRPLLLYSRSEGEDSAQRPHANQDRVGNGLVGTRAGWCRTSAGMGRTRERSRRVGQKVRGVVHVFARG